MAEPPLQNTETAIPTGLSGLAAYFPDRFTNSHRKASSPRPTSYETHAVASQKQLEGTGVTRKGVSNTKALAHTLSMVAARGQCPYRPTITPNKHALQIFTDASTEGWGAHLNERTARGN